MRRANVAILLGLLTVSMKLLTGPVEASFLDDMKDPKEGGFDMSKRLASRTGFLPIPIIITEPAVGYGGGLGILYFHKSKEELSNTEEFDWDTPQKFETPNLSAVLGLGTANGTWATGGMHFGSWFEDRLRYLGVAGYGSVNLQFFGIGDIDISETPLSYNVKAFFLIQELKARILDSPFFAGARYTFTNADSTFDIGRDLPVFIRNRLEVKSGGLGPVLEYDSRDNIMSPNRGISAQVMGLIYDPSLGGDTHYYAVRTFAKLYRDVLKKKLLLGLRLDGRISGGDIPFYAYPFIDMRGIPAMRYQGEYAFVTEGQITWNCWRRWYLLGFLGSGWAVSSLSDLALDNAQIAKGFGFRYLLARVYGLRVGIDVARGPERWAWYLQIGQAWGR
jgi:hypothetical protein